MLFNKSIEDIEQAIHQINEGKKPKDFKKEDLIQLKEIALARKKDKKINQSLFFNLDDLRFATHHQVASYRAKRLACNTLIEVGGGVGIQTIAFSKTCKNVISIEIDKRKTEFAKANLKKLNINNVEVIHGDGLEEIKKIKQADILFCDPGRLPEEEKRSIDSISPNLPELIKNSPTNNIAIELPPRMRDIPFDAEKEYLSINGELRRLTLYFGNLSKGKVSAITLPSQDYLVNNSQNIAKKGELKKFIFEVDEALDVANLAGELNLEKISNQPLLLTSNESDFSIWFKNSFEVIAISNTAQEIKNLNAKKAIIRYKIPSKNYWVERNKLEKDLKGDFIIHIFKINKDYIFAKKV